MMRLNKKAIILIGLSLFIPQIQAAKDSKDYNWQQFIDAYVGDSSYYLYPQAVQIGFKSTQPHRAIDLGAGTGNTVVDMLSKGIEVTAVDNAARSKEIILERTKNIDGKFNFQQEEITNAKLDGNYDLVTSFFSLPFTKKDKLLPFFQNLSSHMNKGSVLAVNFFGNEHDLVKAGYAYGMTLDEINKLLTNNGFKVVYLLNRSFNKGSMDKVQHADVIDVIAVKN